MPIAYQPYTVLLITAAVLSMTLAGVVLKYRPTLGTRSFVVLTGAVSMWAFLILFEVLGRDIPTKAFAGNLKYLFIVTIPVAWFVFSRYYAYRMQVLRPAYLAALCAIPAMTLLFTATNGYHGLMFKSLKWVVKNGLMMPVREYGVWFWIHTVYSYGLLFMGFVFLVRSVVDAKQLYRRQGISLAIAVLAPWLCNVQFLFGSPVFPHLDLTPFAFSISSLALMWGILRYRLLDIVPVAQDRIIHNLSDGVLVIDSDQRILEINAAALEMVGMAPNDLIGHNAEQVIDWWSQLPPTGHADTMGGPHTIEIERNGQSRVIHVATSALRTKERFIGLVITLRDITDVRRAQEALKQSEARFKSLSENAPVIILAVDAQGQVTYVNPAWRALLGHDREQMLGRPLDPYLAEEDLDAYLTVFYRLINGERRVVERKVRINTKAGGTRVFEVTAAANADDEGRITGIIGLAKDVTEEDRLQAQLFQAQKMEAIGTLAGGIAHDFNNLLMGMQANISLLKLDLSDDLAATDKLVRIENQIQTGASLTRQLLGYARKGKYVIANIDIHYLIEETLNVVQRTNKNMVVDRRLDAEPSFMEADQGQMELVLLNLFVNAMDAMPGGGRLAVSTRSLVQAEAAVVWDNVSPGRYIEIQVSDNGVGMEKAILDRIFEPFFTTKEIGQGTGLGLASVYGVVKNHYGDIRVESEPGKGTDVYLLFPAASDDPVKARKEKTAAVHCPEGLHVLLVDDEVPILAYVSEMVQSLGYTVLTARSGREAIRLYMENHPGIDFVMLDMVMPEMDGEAVFKELREINPDVRVIVISGYGRSRQSSIISGGGPHQMLSKPFTRSELTQAIIRLINGQPAGADACVVSRDFFRN